MTNNWSLVTTNKCQETNLQPTKLRKWPKAEKKEDTQPVPRIYSMRTLFPWDKSNCSNEEGGKIEEERERDREILPAIKRRRRGGGQGEKVLAGGVHYRDV